MAAALTTRASGELSRTGIETKLLSEAWKGRPGGDRFVRSLAAFLGSKPNKGTQRVYAFAITEFFNWFRAARGYVPLPSEVRREDALLFVKWLRERGIGVDEQRLEQDSERLLDLQIYRFLKRKPESSIADIRRDLLNDARLCTVVDFTVRGSRQTARVLEIEASELRGDALEAYEQQHGAKPPNPLDIRLACLCQHNLLRRSPSVAEIREGRIDLGLEDPSQAQIGYRVDPMVFRYWANEYTDAKGGDRASTITTKLAALSSYWSWLVKSTGENIPGMDPLLRFNIWREALAEVRPTALNRAKEHREHSVPDRDLFVSVLATTFRKSHGSDARAAASAFLEGADVRDSERAEAQIYDLRDRAALVFAYWTGVRAEELGSIRREDLNFKTGVVSVLGKGNKRRSFRVPDPALRAIVELQSAIDSQAADFAGGLRRAIAEDTAPLFPPLKLWGRAQGAADPSPSEIDGISPSAFAKMLHERAERAGIERGSDDWYKIHPHGLRHLAALEAKRRGVDVATIQAPLGHASLAHTGIYLEVRDPGERSLQPGAAPPRFAPPVIQVPAEPKPLAEKVAAKVAPEAPAILEPSILVEPILHEGEPITTFEPPSELVDRDEIIDEALDQEAEAINFLFDVYEDSWGESGKRTPLKPAQGEDVLRKGVISHCYVGMRSGLGWWAGTTGDLSGKLSYTPNLPFPAMPIIAPSQFGPDEYGNTLLSDGLAALFDEWTTPPEQGGIGVYPNAAAALLDWLNVADLVSEVSTAVLHQVNNGDWIEFENPLSKTTKPPTKMRKHYVGAIVAWFRSTAWQWRPRDSGIGSGEDWQRPDWYDEVDPLSSMDPNDRRELLDWLRVLTGKFPQDREPRFGNASRKDVGEFLNAICAYESQFAEIASKYKQKALKGRVEKQDFEDLQVFADQISRTLARLLKKIRPEDAEALLGDFDYSKLRKERAAEFEPSEDEQTEEEDDDESEGVEQREGDEQRGKKADGAQERLSKFILQLTNRFFGPAAAKDPIITVAALCTRQEPLGKRGRLLDLFRIEGDTIKHEKEFARAFARASHQHSECLARRIARHLWEQGVLRRQTNRKRWSSDPLLRALLQYRTPCPPEQEAELRAFDPEFTSAAVLRTFDVLNDKGREQEQEGPEFGSFIEVPDLLPNPVYLHAMARLMSQSRSRRR